MAAFNAKNLAAAFGLTPAQAAKIYKSALRDRIEGWNARETLEETGKRLEEASNRLVFHGVEVIGRPSLYYLNSGDTYRTTILFDPTKKRYQDGRRVPLSGFFIGNWGDMVERHPRRFED